MIRQLQQDLLTLGYDPGTIDGKWGPNTRGACYDAKEDHPSLPAVTSPPSEVFCKEVAALAFSVRSPSVVPLPPKYADYTRFASQGWKKKDRPWQEIWGATLHQYGCPAGEDPSRHYGLKAHYAITYTGQIYQIRKETDFGWHAQGQSHHNVGIEIVGFFAGIEGDPKTRPGGPKEWAIQSVTAAQIESTKELLRYLKRLLVHHGSDLRLIQPHRMATDDRQPDPGSKVWKEIAIPMLWELGCSFGAVSGKGMPLPEAWDATQTGVKY